MNSNNKDHQQTLLRRLPASFKISFSIMLLSVAAAIAATAPQFKTLADFNTTSAYQPYYGSLVQGLDGNFYGTTVVGGANSQGTVFKVTPAGKITVIYSFCSLASCVDGEEPYAGLTLGTDGNFYGTTYYDGAICDCGTVFKITPAGVLTTLHSFGVTDGYNPWGALVQGTDGYFYGTTSNGGANRSGTVFKINSSGSEFTSLYSFCSLSGCADGEDPRGGLVQGSNGLFYGTTLSGGPDAGAGTVYSISSTGTITTVFSFTNSGDQGEAPYGSLVDIAGNLYGTTELGGSGCSGCGTVFQIVMPAGTLNTLLSFDGTDGQEPLGSLIQATDGNLYGTTESGGANSAGTIFKISTTGTFTSLYNFCSKSQCTDGGGPFGGLAQDTSGNFYGTTSYGPGDAGAGTLFRLSDGLGPFVKTLPTSGKVGAKVDILGTALTGATSVTFNGTAATFEVKSANLISTDVPAGATSGNVQVTVGATTLTSNVRFTVR